MGADLYFLNKSMSVIMNPIFAPFLLISYFIGYARTKSQYNKDLQDLETIKAALNQ